MSELIIEETKRDVVINKATRYVFKFHFGFVDANPVFDAKTLKTKMRGVVSRPSPITKMTYGEVPTPVGPVTGRVPTRTNCRINMQRRSVLL